MVVITVNDLIKQIASLSAAGVAGACCLGLPVILAALTSLGLGFLIRDAYLIPIFAALLGFSLWLLYKSSRAHGSRTPFWMAMAGSLIAIGGLYISPWVMSGGMFLFLAGSILDFINGRRNNILCQTEGDCRSS